MSNPTILNDCLNLNNKVTRYIELKLAVILVQSGTIEFGGGFGDCKLRIANFTVYVYLLQLKMIYILG